MIRRCHPLGLILSTLLLATGGLLHGGLPGGLDAADLRDIQEVYEAGQGTGGLLGMEALELGPELTRTAFRLPREASKDGATVTEQAYLKASNSGAGDFFGTVAVSGDTVVVGAPFEDSKAITIGGDGKSNAAKNSGAAYVFTRNSGKWTQQAYLKANDSVAGNEFGFAVAISGDTIIVGAFDVGVATTTVATSTKTSGAAYIFSRSDGKWTQQQKIVPTPSGAGDAFGYSVAISGGTVVVGAIGEASKASGVGGDATDNSVAQAGAAYVFVRTGSSWAQEAYLKASRPKRGDLFGMSVAISGDSVVVGAPNESSNGKGADGNQGNTLAKAAGAAYVFTRKATKWKPTAYLKAGNVGAGDQFGRAVAISGNTVLVGAPNEASAATGVGGNGKNNGAPKAGAAYVFVRGKKAWSAQAYLKSSSSRPGDLFGYSVAIADDTAVVGAFGGDRGGKNAGAAYVFTRNKSDWAPQAELLASNRGAGDRLGFSVAIAGRIAVCGAISESSSSNTSGQSQSDNRAKDAGASYIYEGIGPLGPSIAIEQPAANELVSGAAKVSLGLTTLATEITQTFTVRSVGSAPLTGLAVNITGTDAADFNTDITALTPTLRAGASTTFIVKFKPTGTASGPRTAKLTVASNDPLDSAFEITLQATAFSTTADKDGDNLNDWAEQQLAKLGFNWQVANPDRVKLLTDGATSAGLFTQAQLQALAISTTLALPDPATGTFKLTLALKKSTDLRTFTPLKMTGAVVNPTTGAIEFDFKSEDAAQFYRIEAR